MLFKCPERVVGLTYIILNLVAEQALLLTQLDMARRGRVCKTVFKDFEKEPYRLNRGPCFRNNQPTKLTYENKEPAMHIRKFALIFCAFFIQGTLLLGVLILSFYFALAVAVM